MSLFTPTSIAVVGASAEPGKVGHDIFKNLLTQGYEGKLYAVNSKRNEVQGQKAYPSITDIPDAVEMAVVVVPAAIVESVAIECGKKGVKELVVISAGFGEIGTEEGKNREASLKKIVNDYGMRLIGPNCLGLLRPNIKMNASFASDVPQVGHVALLSQSGALAVALLDRAKDLGMGFSVVVSMGNKAATNETDLLLECAADPETTVIGLYLESIVDGTKFLEEARKITYTKPIVLIKSGVTDAGTKAVSSHTGALAGSDAAITAACREAGIHRAHTMEDFLDLLRALSTQPPLSTPNVAVITNAGGPGILATDAAEKAGLILPELTPENQKNLKEKLPTTASIHNPIDVIGDAGSDRYEAALNAAAEDPSIDGVVVLLTPQVMTPVMDVANVIIKTARRHPLLPIVASFMGGPGVKDAVSKLQAERIPCFSSPEQAVRMLRELLVMPHEDKNDIVIDTERAEDAQKIIADANGLLSEDACAALLSLYGLPQPGHAVATSPDNAVQLGSAMGFPVIAKISSPQIVHKTDIGGVRANIETPEDVKKAYDDIMANAKKNAPDAELKGILIQKFLPAGHEFIVGGIRDKSFGPVVMVGLGGIYTELFRDTAFRIAPVTEQDAYTMLEDLTAWKLLLGMRGRSQSDIDALADVLMKVSQMLIECPAIKELDFNPVLVDEKNVMIADAKVIVG